MFHRPGKALLLQAILLLALFCVGTTPAMAAEEIASFKVVSGTVEVLRNGKLPAVSVKIGDSLGEGDFVRTRSGSFAEIRFKDGTILKVAQRSRIDIGSYFPAQKKNGANVRLPRGKVEAIVDPARVKQAGEGRRFEVHTPNAVAGVRGTDFIVSHDRNLTGVLVRQGSVYTYNRHMPDRMVTVTAGNITTISSAAPPQPPRQALPSEMQHMERGVTAAKTENGSQSATQGSSQPAATQATQATQAAQGTTSETRTSSGDLLSQSAPLSTTLAPTAGTPLLSGASLTASTVTATPTSTVTTATQPPPPPPPVVTAPPPVVPTATNVNVNVNF
ncbi:FecR family protein [Geotalea sp. SG265]|uniref:FecR family protein n=1 Tax=Geotalea sp. SG265 TaxID=2922867 RepID=UPI001FAF6D79|nr:FecR family protein [Geotalea sp. SG265]